MLQSNFDWSKKSKCLKDGVPQEFFFPTVVASRKNGNLDDEEAERAKYCLGFIDNKECPVRNQCLEYALNTRKAGVWGGTTEQERQRIRKQRQRIKNSA